MIEISEINIARYTLIAILLLCMANFYTSINALAETDINNQPVISVYNR